MATQAQVKAFITQIAPIAQKKAMGRAKWSLPSVCIAQACCESAYGTSPKMIRANAVFGIKVGKSKVHFGTAWKGKAYSTATKEFYAETGYVSIVDMFRAYDSIEESVEDYFDMLAACSRYQGCICEADPQKSITAIKNGGYATSPTYVSTIMGIIKKYNLTQYDGVVTGKADIGYADSGKFVVGKNYVLQSNMYVRKTPGGDKVPFVSFTANARNHAQKDTSGYGILKKGTTVTCQEVKEYNSAIWIRIPSGWVCGIGASGTVYAK